MKVKELLQWLITTDEEVEVQVRIQDALHLNPKKGRVYYIRDVKPGVIELVCNELPKEEF